MSIFAFSIADLLSGIWEFTGALILLCTLAGILWGACKFVDGKIAASLKDPSVLKSLSMLVKPDLVFDENGAVLADRGAWAAIKENGIKITKDDSDNAVTNGLPITIRIAFIQHLPTAPLLTPICPDAIFVSFTRGESFDWIYTLKYAMRCGVDDGPVVRTYRLELI